MRCIHLPLHASITFAPVTEFSSSISVYAVRQFNRSGTSRCSTCQTAILLTLSSIFFLFIHFRKTARFVPSIQPLPHSTTIISPTFLAAANFIILGTIIKQTGPEYSRLPPNYCTSVRSLPPEGSNSDSPIVLIMSLPYRCHNFHHCRCYRTGRTGYWWWNGLRSHAESRWRPR